MKKLVKEQYEEALNVLKDYSYWMFNSEAAINHFKKLKTRFGNHTFSLSLTDYGLVKMTLENGVECLYDVRAITAKPRPNSIDNVAIESKIMNSADLSKEYIEYFHKASVFVSSFFQRAAAFTFLSKMQKETIQGIAHDLSTVI